MKLLCWSSCLLLTLSPIAASAQTPSAAPAPAQPVKEKKVCRHDAATGSILATSVCRTKAQWAEIDAANQRDADQALARRGSTFTARP